MNRDQLNTFEDSELITQYRKTLNSVFIGILFQRYTHLIYGVCLKYLKDEEEAKDASMQIFEKLLVETTKHEITQFKSWLYIVCKNHCLMYLRGSLAQEKNKMTMQKDFQISMESETDLHLYYEDLKEMKLNSLEECLKGLNKEQKLCIEMFYIQEKSYQEVCASTSFSLNNVKSYIQNGKRNLKNCIESRIK